MKKGQIRKALSGFYYVFSEGQTYQTRARGNFRNRNLTPLVGDYVMFESDNLTDGYVLELLPRHNELVRPPVANIDQGVIVMSCVEPNFSSNLLDRFLVTLEYEAIRPIIYLTKVDLLNDDGYQEILEVKKGYEAIGYQVILPSLDSDLEATEAILRLFDGKLTVFMGQTGAGKSTLLNRLSPELGLKTGEISTSLGRGRHTTRHVELIPLGGGLVGDTPGFSAIDFMEITVPELTKQFPEINEAADFCKFRECKHVHEPKCDVKKQVEAGVILKSRYQHYLQFLEEIEKRKPVYGKNKK
ncbi:ribosome small subunit-dependent GTPase A [Vagococcus intermedius]|uniref:Small ribosomal subunit biogenesis GTPase RsgA n=1 Tax=Vagococcus intermedius TaxID=2991418 RepID=A0AAF0I787_9ENTE|nr:ribosome small subunit-dependent GTPase A [Vagococcus intermedius]WEG73169.1 ribosome small subunit-dependent GTPase A [Vagococcus intermedius]WEG75253.1 ribosome small subunit-dependent GTPase A [Vagococcus intermedius]